MSNEPHRTIGRITILAPAFNEEEVIAAFVGAVLPTLGGEDELLIVDDGSTDSTPGLLAEMAGRHGQLRVITHDVNRGLGSALATGFAAAHGDVVVSMDADLSHPLDLVPALVDACRSSDAAYASRFVPGGGMAGVPRLRSVISRAGNVVIRTLLGLPVRDATTGFRAYRRQVVADLDLSGRRFETQLEITVRLADRGATLVELPMRLGSRAAGMSKMRYLRLMPAYGAMFFRMILLRWFGIGRRRRGTTGRRPSGGRSH